MAQNKYLIGSALILLITFIILVLAIKTTTNFYQKTYPILLGNQIPFNGSSRMMAIFNGYTENINRSINMTEWGINTQKSLNITLPILAIAFFAVWLYIYFNWLLKKDNYLNFVFTLLLPFALVCSAYLTFIFELRKAIPTGTSLFTVDGAITIILFSILTQHFISKWAKRNTLSISYFRIVSFCMLILGIYSLLGLTGVIVFKSPTSLGSLGSLTSLNEEFHHTIGGCIYS